MPPITSCYIFVADLIARSAYQMGKTPLLPIFAATLGADGAFLGLIVSVSTFTGIISKPLFGILSDRWGRRIWLIIGTIFFVFIPFFYRFVHTPRQLFIIRLIHGLSTAIYGPTTVAFVAENTIITRRAEHLAWFGIARSIGYIIGPFASSFLLLSLKPIDIFTIIGLLSSICFVPILFLPKTTNTRNNSSNQYFINQVLFSLSAGASTPAIWLSGGLNASMFISLYAIKAFLPVHAVSVGINIALIGLFFSIQECVSIFVKPLGGRLGDQWSHLNTIAIGMLLLGSALPLITVSQTRIDFLLVACLMGCAQAIVFPSTVALVASQINSHHLGAGIGLVGTLNNTGKLVGPILGGFLIQIVGFAQTVQILGLVIFLGSILIWLLKYRADQSSQSKW